MLTPGVHEFLQDEEDGVEVLIAARVKERVDDDERYSLSVKWKQGVLDREGKLEETPGGEIAKSLEKSILSLDYDRI